MRKVSLKSGQVGRFWPSKKPGRERTGDPWCITWYDKLARQTRRESLGTEDFQQACLKVAEHAVLADRPKDARPKDVPIATCLLSYWEDYAKHLNSATSAKRNLRIWNDFWGDKSVDQITRDEQSRFRKFVGEGRLAPSTVDTILSTGRAALARAVDEGMLSSFPRIILIETEEDKRSRPPMGTPITPAYAARLLDAVKCRHLMMFIMIIGNTLARNSAAFELRRAQFDPEENVVCLNPKGRRQNKKYRSTVLVTPTLLPWLLSEAIPDRHYVVHRGKPLKSIKTAWGRAAKEAGLPKGFTPYSFRHGIAREMKRRRVPREQISHYLGHLDKGAAKTTAIYAPQEAQDCKEAAAAIEEVWTEIRKLVKVANFDDPEAMRNSPSRAGNWLNPAKRAELDALIASRVGVTEICRRIGISNTLVYRYRKRATGKTRV